MAPSLSSHCAHRVSFVFLACMVLFAVLLTTGGVAYSVFKHDQVDARTKLERVQRDIAARKMNASQYRAKANALANHWTMVRRLKDEGSQLQAIETFQYEEISPRTREFALRAATARR